VVVGGEKFCRYPAETLTCNQKNAMRCKCRFTHRSCRKHAGAGRQGEMVVICGWAQMEDVGGKRSGICFQCKNIYNGDDRFVTINLK